MEKYKTGDVKRVTKKKWIKKVSKVIYFIDLQAKRR